MNKLFNTLYDIGIIILMAVYAIVIWPYLLWRGIRSIILLNKNNKRPDFDLVKP